MLNLNEVENSELLIKQCSILFLGRQKSIVKPDPIRDHIYRLPIFTNDNLIDNLIANRLDKLIIRPPAFSFESNNLQSDQFVHLL